MRNLVMSGPTTLILAVFAGAVLLVERTTSQEKVRRPAVACVGRSLAADDLHLTLTLACGTDSVTTIQPSAIQRFITNHAASFQCDVKRNGSADCK